MEAKRLGGIRGKASGDVRESAVSPAQVGCAWEEQKKGRGGWTQRGQRKAEQHKGDAEEKQGKWG